VAGTRLEFEWDAANREHLARHGISAAEFEQGFKNQPIQIDEYRVKGEWRTKVIAITDAARLLELIFTLREGRVRAVTAFPLKRRRREFYRERFEI
jgi:uncharacterized DUF497 family protein